MLSKSLRAGPSDRGPPRLSVSARFQTFPNRTSALPSPASPAHHVSSLPSTLIRLAHSARDCLLTLLTTLARQTRSLNAAPRPCEQPICRARRRRPTPTDLQFSPLPPPISATDRSISVLGPQRQRITAPQTLRLPNSPHRRRPARHLQNRGFPACCSRLPGGVTVASFGSRPNPHQPGRKSGMLTARGRRCRFAPICTSARSCRPQSGSTR